MKRVSLALTLTASFCLCSIHRSLGCPGSIKPAQQYERPKSQPAHPQENKKPRQQTRVSTACEGRCISVQDGDTLIILVRQTFLKIHLYGIEAPEKKQAFGIQSKASLWELAFGQSLTAYPVPVEDSDMLQAWVFAGKMNLNTEQIKSGMAWWDRQNARHESKLSVLESAAMSSHIGLWQQKEPIAPWLWRAASTNERVEMPLAVAPKTP